MELLVSIEEEGLVLDLDSDMLSNLLELRLSLLTLVSWDYVVSEEIVLFVQNEEKPVLRKSSLVTKDVVDHAAEELGITIVLFLWLLFLVMIRKVKLQLAQLRQR